jgi:SpoVK/Ycf46/Vps4 family AAA+-type ATPase
MSRSRAQEHDAVRRAMTTLMLELDKLQIATSNNLLVFGITNIPNLIDTAVVRRFSLKSSVNPCLSWLEFKAYIGYLNQPIQHISLEEELQELYSIYKERSFTVGDIKAVYQTLAIDILCNSNNNATSEQILSMFRQGFSSNEHLYKIPKELLNV